MTLESIGCKCNLTYINNYIKTAFLCAPSRQTHDWLCAEFHRRRSAYAVRQWMDACGGTPYMQDSSSNISSRKQSISNQRGMMKHGYLLYVHDESVTPKFPASQDICLSMRCLRHQRADHKRSPAWISGTLVQHRSFKNNMTYGKITPHFANRSASMIQFYA